MCVCVQKAGRYRFAHAGAAAAQHGLPEEHNMPAQHIINMQDTTAPSGNM